MGSISKKELEKAIDELNEKIADPPIKKKDEKKAKKKILEAAMLIEKTDEISKTTIEVIKKLQGKKKKKEDKEVKAKKSEKSSKKNDIKEKNKSKEKKKNSKKEDNKKKGKGTIKDYVINGFKDGKFGKKSNQQVAELVQKKFNSTTNAGGVSWYRAQAEK